MARINDCALCKSHATQEYHSTYKGHPIEFGTSWITKERCYHSNEMQASTLTGIRLQITKLEQENR